jgi:predicted membrane protein
MKMGIGLFWGIVLILIGASIICKVFFDVSLMRVIIAVIFILIGLKILLGRNAFHVSSNEHDVVFNDRRYTEFPITSTEYSTVFGKSIYDFTNAKVPTDSSLKLEFNTVFGNTELWLPKGLPVRIKAEAVFGSAELPNDNKAVFGSANYVSDHDSIVSNFVTIEINTVFGHFVVKQ